MTLGEIQAVNGNAFKNTNTNFYTCNTGTGMESSFAQAWVNITDGTAKAVVGGTTTYRNMNIGESIWNKIDRRITGFNPYGSRDYPKASEGVGWNIFTK